MCVHTCPCTKETPFPGWGGSPQLRPPRSSQLGGQPPAPHPSPGRKQTRRAIHSRDTSPTSSELETREKDLWLMEKTRHNGWLYII